MYRKNKFVSECRPNSFKVSHFQVEVNNRTIVAASKRYEKYQDFDTT